ncbi:MAG: TetR/AcrR family transcriptional regulator [Actinobacteria bacterium]|nr:TetR/AcrR family transcriptional regulator [Actinomycetota bacterium]
MGRAANSFTGDSNTRDLILASARADIDQHGIIGLRLSAVAEKSQVSVPLIYKYFEDRDALLAVVLGDWYEQFVFRYQNAIDTWIDSATSITLEEFAQLSPKPRAGAMQTDREFRLKVLATALENPQLRLRVSKITNEVHTWGEQTMDRAIPKLPEPDRHFDRRLFSWLLFNTMYVFHDMLDSKPIEDEEYISFLVNLIRASSRANLGAN